jgi:hypothetical protein
MIQLRIGQNLLAEGGGTPAAFRWRLYPRPRWFLSRTETERALVVIEGEENSLHLPAMDQNGNGIQIWFFLKMHDRYK